MSNESPENLAASEKAKEEIEFDLAEDLSFEQRQRGVGKVRDILGETIIDHKKDEKLWGALLEEGHGIMQSIGIEHGFGEGFSSPASLKLVTGGFKNHYLFRRNAFDPLPSVMSGGVCGFEGFEEQIVGALFLREVSKQGSEYLLPSGDPDFANGVKHILMDLYEMRAYFFNGGTYSDYVHYEMVDDEWHRHNALRGLTMADILIEAYENLHIASQNGQIPNREVSPGIEEKRIIDRTRKAIPLEIHAKRALRRFRGEDPEDIATAEFKEGEEMRELVKRLLDET